MKTAIAAILTAAAVHLPGVAADFDLWYVTVGGVGGSSNSWQVHEAEESPGCDGIDGGTSWDNSDDVSGSKRGIRCKGCGTDGPMDEIEMNFGDDLHFTVYRDSDYEFDYGGDIGSGNCLRMRDEEERCNVGPIGIFNGYRMLRCYSDLTPDDIN